MRESGIQNYRPRFKSPLYPYLQIIAILAYIFIIIEMGRLPLLITSIFILMGLSWYWFFGRIRSNKESALLQLINKIKAKDLETTSLDTELKEIIRERDNLHIDRFDRLIEKAIILDIDKTLTKEEFFHIVADNVSKIINKSSEYYYNKILEREAESSTVLTESLAIPHIIIEGEKKFNILLARCKDGINFNNDAKKVTTVFVITGTRDERNYHLQALAAIAQIVQNSNFEKKWLKAKNIEALRDLVLLGDRRRK
jgi:mannitol/fructose-specific phosphotransferase system IIA component (Ntr-type)